MEAKKETQKMEKVKAALDSSGLTRRESILRSFALLGAGGAVLTGMLVNANEANAASEPVNCSPDSCAQACLTCRDGCSNGPDK